MRGDLNLRMSAVASSSARLLGCILCLCKCVVGEAVCVCVYVCGGAALTRSPKNTSLAVKGVRSHRAFPLIHTGLASAVPVVKSTRRGNTKLRHQLPGSHYIWSRENTAKLNNTFPIVRWHNALPNTLTLAGNNQRSVPVAPSPDRVQ